MKELNVALRDGTEVKDLLDAQNLTTRVEMKMGAQVPSGPERHVTVAPS